MSQQHPRWRFEISEVSGSLVIMPCPGCNGVDLTTSLQQLQQDGVKQILTLMTDEELDKFNVANMPLACETYGIEWLHFPIEDDCIPEENHLDNWKSVKTKAINTIQQGGAVAVHCKGGSGRAGLCTAMLLLDLGYEMDEAMAMVKSVRPSAFKRDAQVDYLQTYSKAIAA